MDELSRLPRKATVRQGDGQRGSRLNAGSEPVVRPFTSMGSSELNLPSTVPVRARAATTSSTRYPASAKLTPDDVQHKKVDGEFDVRQFLLDQKVDQPLHKSSLFRASGLVEEVNASNNATSSSTALAFREVKARKNLLPRMEASQSMGALPPSGIMSSTGTSSHKARPNQQPEDDESNAVSHFYTLERMAESCYHAIQNRNKTWLFLPGSEERSKGTNGGSTISGGSITGVERPSRRMDLMDLQRCYDAALQFSNRKRDHDVECSDKLAMVDRDFVAIQTRVSEKYAKHSVVDRSPGFHEAIDGADDLTALSRLFFEQKWADVVLGELEAMLTVSFLEQGVVLRKARIQYAQCFFQLERLYSEQWSKLNQALDDLEQLKADIRRADAVHEKDTQTTKERYEGEIKRLTATFEITKGDMEKKVSESKDQMTKMGDTMKTLNAIFRQMREDTEKVKAVELRENYIKLEQKYDQCCEEIERLRPLVDQNQQLNEQITALTNERDKFKDDMAQLDILVGSKDETIASLMEQQSDMLAAQELREAKDEEMRKRAAEEEEDNDDIEIVEDGQGGDGDSSQPRTRRARRYQSSAVCVRCKQDLRVMSANGGLSQASTHQSGSGDGSSGNMDSDAGFQMTMNSDTQYLVKRKRIQCLHFRILLPNLRGRRPQRDISWTISCMRAIMFAKQIDDTMCRRSGGAFPTRIRMPEFVYAWFSPWRAIKDEKFEAEYGSEEMVNEGETALGDGGGNDAIVRSLLSSEQRQVQADEDRWCLYYGVKALVQRGYLEAKLFLSLLDEKFGEDELVFILYCYQLLDVLVGGRLNWGPLREKVSHQVFSREYERMFGGSNNSGSSPSPAAPIVVPKTIWISPYHASLATSVVLARATESEREALDKKMQEYVVTNVPRNERPLVYLTPEQMGIKPDPFSKKKSRRYGKNDDNDDDDLEYQQLIDAHFWIELMMMEYKEEQAHRRAAIRLMFQTAMASVTGGDLTAMPSIVSINGANMDMEQFRVMVRTLNDETPSFVIATLFRNAYTRGNGAVTFDSFLEAAENGQFFSTCMRLESPAACIARLSCNAKAPTLAALSTSSRAAYSVEKLFTILRHELTTAVAMLPIWTRSIADALSYEISSTLMGNEEAVTDGMRLLSSFHRLIEYLLLSKLVKREVTGEVVSSKHISSIEKALEALVESVRIRDKSSAERLIDTVKQKLCVKRVQMIFRRHLQHDNGAPLAMRSLLHRSYGHGSSDFRSRQAIRPLSWLLSVIAGIFRQSIKSHRLPKMLVEMSSVSSAVQSNKSPGQYYVSTTMNGGIGPAPRPLVMEIIYDFFIDKFGTRWEAEKLIHDLFFTCRSFVRVGDPFALVLSYVCCMSNASPDDRLLGQNEAVAFLQAICRCGLHDFAIVNPKVGVSAMISSEPLHDSERSGGGDDDVALDNDDGAPDDDDVAPDDDTAANHSVDDSSDAIDDLLWKADWVSVETAEKILFAAFSKLRPDQKQRMRQRLEEAALECRAAANVQDPLGSSILDSPCVEAGRFLVLALHEWRRYVLHRMNELRVACCALEGEMAQFESVFQIETVASALQKADIPYSSEELCVVFRRLFATEISVSRDKKASATARNSSAVNTSSATRAQDPMSDRMAAACFPLIARETLHELAALERAASKPFKVTANPMLSYEFLKQSWKSYEEPCRHLMEQLRQVGKNNDIQAEANSRGGGATKIGGNVLYLSSSTSGMLSSQDVMQLEAIHTLFLEKFASAKTVLDQNNAAVADKSPTETQTGSIAIKRDGSMLLLDAAVEQENVVNEAWKVLRQLIVVFVKLRRLAGLGQGALPDEWDAISDHHTA